MAYVELGRELRRVHATMRERGADAQARALAEHVRALTDCDHAGRP